jgi:hypothetical protein
MSRPEVEAQVVEYVEQRVREVVTQRWTAAAIGSIHHPGYRRTAGGAVLSDGAKPTKDAEKQDARLLRRHEEAWAAYEDISEVTTLVDGTSGLLSQCRFYMGKRVRVGDKWVDLPAAEVEGVSKEQAQLADAVLARITDETGSQSGLVRNISQNWSVVGATKLVGYAIDTEGQPIESKQGVELPEGSVEVWRAVAPGSLRLENKGKNTWTLKNTEHGSITLTNPIVYDLKWTHPRWPDQALGWVMSAIDICRDLRAFTGGQRAAARSGIPADLLLAPTEANPKRPAQLPVNQQPDDEPPPDAQQVANEFAELIEEMIGGFIMDVLADLDSGAAVVPGVLTVGQDFIEKFRTISFARVVDRGLGELVKQARDRLAEAADCPPEMLSGLGSTNRWNGGQIADDEYRRYFRPKANAIADQLTAFPVRHQLLAVGQIDLIDKLGLRVLVDPSEAVAQPDYSKLVGLLLDRAVIGPSGALQLLGLPDTLAPSPEELEFMEKWKTIGKAEPKDNPGRGDQGPPSEPSDVDSTKGAVVVRGHVPDRPPSLAASTEAPLGDALLRIELDTRVRLTEASEAALDRAIDRAHAKLRSWARKAKVSWPSGDDPVMHAMQASKLFADNPTSPEDLWMAALQSLAGQFRRIANEAYAAAQDAIGATVPAVEIEAAIGRAEAALIDGMMDLANQQVFGPAAVADEGEVVDVRVPAPLMRRVLAIAGGALGVGSGLDPDAEAALGLAFGPLLDRITPDWSGLEWYYGPGVRTKHFQPHQELDGQRFSGPTDPALGESIFLSKSEFWFPGDHQGCQCAWKVIYDQ